jgi:hypothetical protein
LKAVRDAAPSKFSGAEAKKKMKEKAIKLQIKTLKCIRLPAETEEKKKFKYDILARASQYYCRASAVVGELVQTLPIRVLKTL